MANNKKPRKKYNPQKYEDVIHPLEHVSGLLGQYRTVIYTAINENKFTIDNLVHEGVLLYRWIYIHLQMLPEYDIVPVREWIENEFTKLANITTNAELNEIKNRKIKIHWTIKIQILALIENCYSLIIGIRSRTKYAKIFNEALVLSNMRINLIAPQMKRFIDENSTKEAMQDCRARIFRNEIRQMKENGSKAYYDETGDIKFTKIS